MQITKRISNAFKSLTSPVLRNSIGTVMRNYAGEQQFRPEQQLRGITYKAIDKIGQSLSVYEPLVIKKNGDALENHPLYNLFYQPNKRQRGSDFIYLVGMLYEIYGESFWYLAKGEMTNKVKEIYLLNPAQMELKVVEGELVGYILHKSDGTQVPLMTDEVIHDKRPNPFNEWRGISVMERASVYIDTEITTASFTLNYMRNNASPSGIVSLPDMDRDTFKQFAAQWREGYEGPQNAGKTAFIRGGEASFKAVGATLKDVDQKITRDMAKDDVLMMLDVPKGLLGASGEKGLGRNEIEPLEYIFAKYKLEPMMTRLDAIFTRLLEMMPKNQQQGYISHESPVPEDKKFMLETHEKGVDKWITRNEARQQMGLPPIAGGDVLPMLVNQPQTPASSKRVVLKKAEAKKTTDPEEFRQASVNLSEKYAKQVKREMTKFAEQQEAQVIERINATSKTYEEWLFSVKEDSEKLALLLAPIILALMREQGEGVAHFITGELLVIPPEVERAVQAHILEISGVYNADTIKALEKTLSEGQAAGESLAKLKKRVETEYSAAKGYRAERIARTESLKASSQAAELAYKQSGYSKVRWFTNPGACEFCKTYEGRTKEIGGTYNKVGDVVVGAEGNQMRLDYDDIQYPPLHPNCTCSLVPED